VDALLDDPNLKRALQILRTRCPEFLPALLESIATEKLDFKSYVASTPQAVWFDMLLSSMLLNWSKATYNIYNGQVFAKEGTGIGISERISEWTISFAYECLDRATLRMYTISEELFSGLNDRKPERFTLMRTFSTTRHKQHACTRAGWLLGR
jgi:hypothetical protein